MVRRPPPWSPAPAGLYGSEADLRAGLTGALCEPRSPPSPRAAVVLKSQSALVACSRSHAQSQSQSHILAVFTAARARSWPTCRASSAHRGCGSPHSRVSELCASVFPQLRSLRRWGPLSLEAALEAFRLPTQVVRWLTIFGETVACTPITQLQQPPHTDRLTIGLTIRHPIRQTTRASNAPRRNYMRLQALADPTEWPRVRRDPKPRLHLGLLPFSSGKSPSTRNETETQPFF